MPATANSFYNFSNPLEAQQASYVPGLTSLYFFSRRVLIFYKVKMIPLFFPLVPGPRVTTVLLSNKNLV